MTVTIVPMLPGHIDELMVFERELFGPEAWSAHGYRMELADSRNRWYVVALDPDDDDRLVGWAGIMLLGEEAEILTVGVVPFRRRQGVACLLLDALESHAAGRGVTTVFLEVRVDNVGAIALYEGRGYERVGTRRGYYEHGRVDASLMRRDLAA
ncbi:ribosomal protein S18-alanine N-acetyltransferase [Jatrophihabitans sp. YIM 134969]